MQDFTERLAQTAFEPRLLTLPEQVLGRAKQLFLDFLAVALGGKAHAESSPALAAAVDELTAGAPGRCTAVGSPRLYPAAYAALLNASYAHSMDYDDTHALAIMHLGAPVFATALALAEERDASGMELLRAAVAGYEVGGRLGRAFGENVHRAGFHATATSGIFACSAAAALLTGMTAEQLRDAWGINLSQAAGSQQFSRDGAWTKRLHPGFAAHDAIVAAALARAGFRGVRQVFEGEWGYASLYARGQWEPRRAWERPPDAPEFEILAVAVKPYPCCRYLHPVIDALLEMASEGATPPEEVRRVQVRLPAMGVAVVAEPQAAKRRPRGIVDGQFSVYFAAAAALIERRFGWASYRLLGDPAVEALMDRVEVEPAGDLQPMQAEVTLHTVRGVYGRRVLSARGEPDRFPSWQETLEKFREMAVPVLGEKAAGEVARTVEELERVPRVSLLTRLLRPGGKGDG